MRQSLKTAFAFLALANVAAADMQHDPLAWNKAYINAYKPARELRQGSQNNHTNKTKSLKARAVPSLADISAGMSQTSLATKKKSAQKAMSAPDLRQSATLGLFKFGICLINTADITEALKDTVSCGAAYTCMSFWGQEVLQLMLRRQWCYANKFESVPEMQQAAALARFRTILHDAVAPVWNFIMLVTSPAIGQEVDLSTGVSSVFLQIAQKKQECENADSLPDQVQCMLRKVREVKDVRPDFSKLSPEVFQAMQNAYRSHKKGMSMLQNGGLGTLRNSIEDPIPMGFGDINPTPTASNPTSNLIQSNSIESPVGVPGPLVSSVGTLLGGLASKNRYSHITPGLKLTLAEPTTRWVKQAVSMDGSPGAMYMNAGSAKHFHLYLPGGYFCYNQEMCFERCMAAPMLCSTTGYEEEVVFSGTFNPNNGGMEGWTHAVLSYTSSDAFFGQTFINDFTAVEGTRASADGTTNETIYGTFFQGFSMVSAALRKFITMGLGRYRGHTLVVSGCSSGAIGLTPMTDMIPKMLSLFAKNMKFRAFPVQVVTILDSAPITNGPTPINGEMPLPDQSQALLYMLYTMPGLDPGLKATYPGCFREFGNLCVWSPYVFPKLKEANVVMHNLWDSFQLGMMGSATGGALNSSGYILGLKLVFETMAVMRKGTKKQQMFGINCYDHCYVENPWWWRLTPATAKEPFWKWTAKDAFHAALDKDLGHKVMDELVQFNAGCIGQSHISHTYGKAQLASNLLGLKGALADLKEVKTGWR